MAAGDLDAARGTLGPLLWELENQGCTLWIIGGPTTTGRLHLQVVFPEDEYVEKRCRRILHDWRRLTTGRGDALGPAPA